MREQLPDPQEFIDSYDPSTPVVFEATGLQITLGQAMAAEAMFCTADPARRQDPARRIGYVANILAAAGKLRVEDTDLIPQPE